MHNRKFILAITGASGAVYAKLIIRKFMDLKFSVDDCCIIFSETAKEVWNYELPEENINDIPFTKFQANDLFAPPASGSAGYDAMIVCPCSMGTLGRIASGTSNNLIIRAADVMLKERKKLILVTREMPLSLIHINNMKTITEAGGIICPASPSMYSLPKNADDLLNTVIEKILSLAEIENQGFNWGIDKK